MSAMKARLLAALDRDPDLLYAVYLAMLDRKFCGPWVPLKDALGQPTDMLVREDHSGEACAWVKQPRNANSFGQDGQWEWNAAKVPVDDIDDAVDAGKTEDEIGMGGFAEDITDAMHAADEVLREAGWVMVPKADWQSPSDPEGPMAEPSPTGDPHLDLMDSLVSTMPPEERAKYARDRDKYRSQYGGVAKAPTKPDPKDPFAALKGMFKGGG